MATSRSINPNVYDRELAIVPERDALTRALAESEERYQRLVHRVGMGVFRAAAGRGFVEVNPALVHMLGYGSESEFCALSFEQDLFVDHLEGERLRARLARGPIDRLSSRWKRKDGTCLTVRLSVRAIHDERHQTLYYDGVVEDLTDRLRQQELMRRTERMACLGATLAGVAHELNNPLAAILGFAQLLLKKDSEGDARSALETMEHEAARAGKIVRDLLALARKREAERHARVNLNDVVAYIVGTRRYALETHGISCVSMLDPHLPTVAGDRTQLEQVILNLLNNAEQAIRALREDGGRVQIRSRREGHSVVLEIEDDGPGIPAETLEQIWDPFWTTKGMGAGTGLGLTVVRDIVSSHGGEISATAIESGARFVVRLPALDGHNMAAADLLDETAPRALDVLVVDPDAQSSGFLTAFLASRGHAALAAQDIDYAMRLVHHLTFDAVICDSSVAQGNTMLAALRTASGCADARFIIAAGGAESTARLPFPLPTATALVMRPYDLEELRVLLED
jgi:PAS domain S-box-containing protein